MFAVPTGAVVVVIVWLLDLQPPMQSMPITTDVMSSNLDQGEVYNIMWYSLSVTCDRSVVFSSTNKTYHHDITEILLKVALNTIKQTNSIYTYLQFYKM
jgi:plasmid replication initiation protein